VTRSTMFFNMAVVLGKSSSLLGKAATINSLCRHLGFGGHSPRGQCRERERERESVCVCVCVCVCVAAKKKEKRKIRREGTTLWDYGVVVHKDSWCRISITTKLDSRLNRSTDRSKTHSSSLRCVVWHRCLEPTNLVVAISRDSSDAPGALSQCVTG